MDGLAARFGSVIFFLAVAGLLSASAVDTDQPYGECVRLTLSVSGSGDESLLSWNEVPAAQGYCVVKGDLGTLRTLDGEFNVAIDQELASNTTDTSVLFSGTPDRGEGYWFLVRDNPTGTFDSGCPAQVEGRDDEILSAGDVCVN